MCKKLAFIVRQCVITSGSVTKSHLDKGTGFDACYGERTGQMYLRRECLKVMIVNKTTDTDLIGSNRIKEYAKTSSLAEVKYKKIGVGLGLGLSTALQKAHGSIPESKKTKQVWHTTLISNFRTTV